jgi:DNA-binding NarL/FixJ family response regulator
VRVVVAEDQVLLREGLGHVLAGAGHEVVAGVGDGEALLDAVPVHRPDLVITEVRMPPTFGEEGLGAALELRRRHPGLPIVVLSQYIGQAYAAELLETATSAVGYLLKDRIADIPEFVATLRTVLDGGTVVDPEVVRQLLRRRADPLARLSPREREVLGLVAEGRSNAAIMRELVVTEATVVKHVGAIFTKLDLPPADDSHRRVLAVLTYLRATGL